MKTYAPTTPSRRQTTTVQYRGVITSGKPYRKLTKKLKSRAGRNSQGRITVRHQGGGHKKLYRIIDFKQNLMNDPATVLTIEYDPYRSAFISLVEYEKAKKKKYILAFSGIKTGSKIVTDEAAPLLSGNRLRLKNIPVGYQIHNVEMKPWEGGKLARSAGSYAEILANDGGYTDLKLSSSEV